MEEKTEIAEHETLAEALLHAQMEYPPLEKGSTVKVTTKTGGNYTYQYADLAYTRKVTDPYLWKHGLVVNDRTEWRDGKEVLISTLSHIHSKESVSSEVEVSDSQDMKGLGANITYGRRYNYWNLTGRIGEDDSEDRPTQRRRPSAPTKTERESASPERVTRGDAPPSEDVGQLKGQASQLEALVHKDALMTKLDVDTLKMRLFGKKSYPDDAGALASFITELSKVVDGNAGTTSRDES